MLNVLPDRPLSIQELETLAQADAIGFVFPATPNSIRAGEDGTRQIHDLLITTGETVVALAYDEEQGWIIVGRTTAENRKEAALDYIIEYRDYDIEDPEKVLEFVTELYGAADRLTDED